jgi:hypothetical protein
VGLPHLGKGLDLRARISSPHTIAQITTVNDFLIVFAVGCARETLIVDIPAVEKILTLRLARALRHRWPKMSRESRRYVLALAPEVIS